jgi:hypothetical protein
MMMKYIDIEDNKKLKAISLSLEREMEYKTKLKTSREAEYHLRTALAYNNSQTKFFVDHNDDVLNIKKCGGCFSKSLNHNEKGQADKKDVTNMLLGIRKCKCHFNKIKYPTENVKLINPSAIFSWEKIGPFKSSIEISPSPSITSSEAAAEMVELYEMVLLRDVPFSEYEGNIFKCIDELNILSNFTGPKEDGKVNINTLFRGNTKGDLIGPYISQFLWLSFNYGICEINQKYKYNTMNRDFMTTWDNYLNVQNGTVNEILGPKTEDRYMITLRDLASYVHLNDSLQATLNASLILNKLKCPTIFPKDFINENLFIDLGSLDLQNLICETIRVSMLCCWYHKWNNLRVRPEAFGSLINKKKSYIHQDLLSSNILKRIYDKYENLLLPQAYPEGSPCCPSYPSSHAVCIGVGTTLLKAWYDEDFMFDGFIPNQTGNELNLLGIQLRVGDELDKLASNISMGCCAAGINSRSDLIGLELGETIAIKMLEETVHKYTYNVKFRFHKRDNVVIEISNF